MSAPGSPQAERIARLEAENTMLRERLLQYELTLAEAEQQPSPMATTSAQFPGSTNAHGLPTTAPTAQRYTNMWADDVETYPPRPSFDTVPNHPSTEVVAFDGCPNDPYHPSSMPIYQTATFVQPSINEFGEYDYTRSGNPTRTAVETLAAKLEAAHAAFAFTSGMAALANLISLFNAGDEILAGDDLYGGMHRLLTQVANKQGITVRFVDTTNADALESQITPGKTKLLHIESPTNPRVRITDLRAVCAIAHRHGAYVSVDCTMMTPVRCQPLALGCDAVVHSATKFFSGHSDVMGGFLCVKDPTLARRAAFNQNAVGTALAPFDCWLMLRGLKTLVLRVERMELNALAVARYLSNQQHFITALHYAGLNPSKAPEEVRRLLTVTQAAYDTHRSQCTGPGTVLSFETGSIERSKAFVNACRLFKLTVSFGSCNSLVEMPCALSHASIPKDQRTLPEDLVRLSIGIESVHDLIRDISHAIREALLAAAPTATEDDKPK